MKRQLEIKCKTCGKLHIKANYPVGEIKLEWICNKCKNKNIVTLIEKTNKISICI